MPLSNKANGAICICGGFLIHFSLGTIYTFGNMSPYITSYLRNQTSSTWTTSGSVVWVFSLSLFAQGFTMALGGVLERKIGARLTCLIGAWTMSFGVLVTYASIQRNFWSVLVTYGLVFGLGVGLTYSVALASAIKWFPDKKGLVAGIVVAGFGLGSLIFNIVQTKFINPLNIKAVAMNNSKDRYFEDPEVLSRIPWCFILIGSCYAVIQVIGVGLLMDSKYKVIRKETKADEPPEEQLPLDQSPKVALVDNNLPDDAEVRVDPILNSENPVTNSRPQTPTKVDNPYKHSIVYSSVSANLPDIAPNDYTIAEAVKTKKFWLLWSTFFFNVIVIVTISSLYKSFGQTFILDDNYFAAVGATAALFNAGGRLVWGRLLDNFQYRYVMSALNVLMIILMATFYLCSFVTSDIGSKVMYFIWVCLCFLALSGSFAIFPTATAQAFGSKFLAIVYGVIFSGCAASSIISGVICSILKPYIHYYGLFLLAAGSAVISLILTQFYEVKQKEMILKAAAATGRPAPRTEAGKSTEEKKILDEKEVTSQ